MHVRIGTRLLLLVACLHTLGCAPLLTEPRPDIPEVPNESTVLLELGDESVDSNTLSLGMTAMVGDPSLVAKLTNATILETNEELGEYLRLIKMISDKPPTDYQEGVWSWIFPTDERTYEFTIATEPQPNTFRYLLLGNKGDAPLNELFSGTMTLFPNRAGAQQGFGSLRFTFDDSNPRSSRGIAHVSFRRRGGVRQVNVGLADFRVTLEAQSGHNAVYTYLLFPNRAGRFKYHAITNDFDGIERETGVDVAFTSLRSGRGMILLPAKQDTDTEEILIEECWDPSLSLTFQASTPEISRFVDGNRTNCPRILSDIQLLPPATPITDPNQALPTLPAKHPLEED
jgi:hypothetical protein